MYGRMRLFTIMAILSSGAVLWLTHLQLRAGPAHCRGDQRVHGHNDGAVRPGHCDDHRQRGSPAPGAASMSLNSCVQQTFSRASGRAFGGYLIIDQVRQPLQNYGLIGWIAAGIAIACIGLAARLRRQPASASSPELPRLRKIMG